MAPRFSALQRHRRRSVARPPRSSPCLSIASTAYCEHVGSKTQREGRLEETYRWYSRIARTASLLLSELKLLIAGSQNTQQTLGALN